VSHIKSERISTGACGVRDLACYQESSAEPQNHSRIVGHISFSDGIPVAWFIWLLGGGKVLFEMHLSDGCMHGGTTEVFSSTTSLSS
jgi:hypothetical protein